jgi:uncharacterized protein
VKLLAFSDVHADLGQAELLVERSATADVVVGVGDFASVHEGLRETINVLRAIEGPVLLVPGNNETNEALREACRGWDSARVLHGQGAQIDRMPFYGLGAGVPMTPWDWSFDLSEKEAADMLAGCPEGCVLAVHSPPHGYVDVSRGRHLGSESVLHAIESKRPRLALCGHIHEQWGQEATIGPTRVRNLGPAGAMLDLEQPATDARAQTG